jgi:hypothetical protein
MDQETVIAGTVGVQPVATSRGILLRQVWGYTALVAFVVGGVVCALSDDVRLFVPIAILSALVGVIGSLLAILRTAGPATAAQTSIFR